jgi:ribose transport system substrate-binding protein
MITSRVGTTTILKSAGALGAVLALAACGSSATSGAGTDGTPSAGASSTGASSVSQQSVISAAGVVSDTSFCGTKKITLGIYDGFGINGWSKSSMAAVRSEAAKCPNVTQLVEIGGGNLQKSISDVNSMVAQGIDALVIIPDFGKSELPSLQAATRAGVKVVAWGADPGGTVGKDYVDYVDWDPYASGKTWAQWMVKAVHDKGNVLFLGGPAGNPVSTNELRGVTDVLASHPDIHLLTGNTDWPVTNWDPAQAQQVMASLLAKYPTIDGVITDDGQGSVGALRAFAAAGRQLVPFTAIEVNQLGCYYNQVKASNPDFQLATISSRNWLGRVAARKAIAAAEGLSDDEPSIYQLPLDEDTLAGKKPQCVSDLPQDAFTDAKLTAAQIDQYGKTS